MNNERKTPSKPQETTASTQELLEHYHNQLHDYNEAVAARFQGDDEKIAGLTMEPIVVGDRAMSVTREDLIDRIRRQNHRLGRHIKARSHELLLQKAADADGKPVLKNGRTVGLTYQEILQILAKEFPEASTSVACLRWYVVHMRGDARDEGKEWPDLPQIRPRSGKKPAKAAVAAANTDDELDEVAA